MRKKQLTDKLQKRRAAENISSVFDAQPMCEGPEEYEEKLSEELSRREQKKEKRKKQKNAYIKSFRFVWWSLACIWLF